MKNTKKPLLEFVLWKPKSEKDFDDENTAILRKLGRWVLKTTDSNALYVMKIDDKEVLHMFVEGEVTIGATRHFIRRYKLQ